MSTEKKMITEKMIEKAIREVGMGKRKTKELKDPGERGAGRLALKVRTLKSDTVVAEWYAVFYRDGKPANVKLGTYPHLELAPARDMFRDRFQSKLTKGETPSASARSIQREAQAGGNTVKDLFQAYVDHLKKEGARCAKLVEYDLLIGKYAAVAVIGPDRAASSITPQDILGPLSRAYERGAVVKAKMLRGYMHAAFAYVLESTLDYTRREQAGKRWGLTFNPVSPVKAQGAAKPGQRFLSPTELRRYWLWVMDFQRVSLIASAALIHMATGQRVEEILKINAASYSKDEAMVDWSKTKNGKPHAIPLPPQAVEVLSKLAPNEHGLYFWNDRDHSRTAHYDSVRAVTVAFRAANPDIPFFTPRDIRRTWKTLGAAGARISEVDLDRIQNHTPDSGGSAVSKKHYNKYDYIREKRAAMELWSEYLARVIAGKVTVVAPKDHVVSLAA